MGSANRGEMLAPQCCSRKTVAFRRLPWTPKARGAQPGAPIWGTEQGLRGGVRRPGRPGRPSQTSLKSAKLPRRPPAANAVVELIRARR
jgi:hypothetical protein